MAGAGGFSLHAGVAAEAYQRDKLERLCRYITRPAVAEPRLSLTAGGRIRYSLKTPWRDGTTHLRLDPVELIARLAALVPHPRTNQVLYHGVLAANARWRPQIVPLGQEASSNGSGGGRPNWTWAELLRRGLDVDGAACPTDGCEGRLRFVASVMERGAVERILRHLGLPFAPVVPAPARAPPLAFDAA